MGTFFFSPANSKHFFFRFLSFRKKIKQSENNIFSQKAGEKEKPNLPSRSDKKNE